MSLKKKFKSQSSLIFFITEGLFLVGFVPCPPHLPFALWHLSKLETVDLFLLVCDTNLSRFTTVPHIDSFSLLFFLFPESHPLPPFKARADQASNFISFYSILLLKHCIHSKAPCYQEGSAMSMLHLQLQFGLHLSSQQGHQTQHIKTEICPPSPPKHILLPF